MPAGGDSSELPYVTLDRPSPGKRQDGLDLDFLFTVAILYLLSRSATIPLHKHNVRPSRSTSIHRQPRRRFAQERPLRVLAEPGRQSGIQGRKLEVRLFPSLRSFGKYAYHVYVAQHTPRCYHVRGRCLRCPKLRRYPRSGILNASYRLDGDIKIRKRINLDEE